MARKRKRTTTTAKKLPAMPKAPKAKASVKQWKAYAKKLEEWKLIVAQIKRAHSAICSRGPVLPVRPAAPRTRTRATKARPLAKPKPKTVNPMAQMVQQYLAPRYAKPSKLYMQRLRELGLAKGSRFADFTRSMAPVGIGYDPTVLRELRPKKPKKAKKKVPHQFRGHGQPMFYGYG